MTESIAQNIKMTCHEGGSSKQYTAQLVESSDGSGWLVSAQYGAIGGAQKSADKVTSPVAYEVALKEYQKLVKSKLGKGYVAANDEGGNTLAPALAVASFTDIRPQLLNVVTEGEARALIYNPSFCAEEKHDGERRPIIIDRDDPIGPVYGTNRKGQRVSLPQSVIAAVASLAHSGRTVLDGEIIGETVYVWDILELKGENLRQRPLEVRQGILQSITDFIKGAVVCTPTARTKKEKSELLDRIIRDGNEGMVFKRIGSTYTPNRPASGGDWFKYKLVATATVRVKGINVGKRSVVMEMLDGVNWVEVGSVTIPPNHPIPSGGFAEIQYLYVANQGGCLFQPVYRGVRLDQDETDCGVAQLKYKGVAQAA